MTIFNPNGTKVSRETLEGLDGFREYPEHIQPSAEDFLLNLADSSDVHMHLDANKGFPTFVGRSTKLGHVHETVSVRMVEAGRQVRADIDTEEGARFGAFLRQLDNLAEVVNG